MTDDAIEGPLEALPAFGLRKRSRQSRAIHRFPDPDEAEKPLPPCVLEGTNNGMPEEPGEYMRARVALAVETRRFSLCSYEECFGRLEAVADCPMPDVLDADEDGRVEVLR